MDKEINVNKVRQRHETAQDQVVQFCKNWSTLSHPGVSPCGDQMLMGSISCCRVVRRLGHLHQRCLGQLTPADPCVHLLPLFLFFVLQICPEVSKLLLFPNEQLMSLTGEHLVFSVLTGKRLRGSFWSRSWGWTGSLCHCHLPGTCFPHPAPSPSLYSGNPDTSQLNLPLTAPAPPEHPSAHLTAQFPVTPNCQVQYLPLAAPVFSEQGVTISLQVSPRVPALPAQLQPSGQPLSPSTMCPRHPKLLFSLPVSLQTTFQVAGMAIPLPVSPVPFSMPEPASSSPSHLTLALSEHFYTSLFFALEMAGAFNMTIPVSRASKQGRGRKPAFGGTALPHEWLQGAVHPAKRGCL